MSNDIIEYGEWTDEQAFNDEQRLNQMVQQKLRLVEGVNVLRFMPGTARGVSPFKIVAKHYVDKPGEDESVSVLCPRKMEGQACPICQEAADLEASGNPFDAKLAERLWPSTRIFANAVDVSLDVDPAQLAPKPIELPYTVYKALIALKKNRRSGGDFTHPEHGYAVTITREGKGKRTRYTNIGADINGRQPLASMEWLRQSQSLDRFAALPSRDEMKEALSYARQASGGGPAVNARSVGHSEQQQRRLPQQRRQSMQDDIDSDDAIY